MKKKKNRERNEENKGRQILINTNEDDHPRRRRRKQHENKKTKNNKRHKEKGEKQQTLKKTGADHKVNPPPPQKKAGRPHNNLTLPNCWCCFVLGGVVCVFLWWVSKRDPSQNKEIRRGEAHKKNLFFVFSSVFWNLFLEEGFRETEGKTKYYPRVLLWIFVVLFSFISFPSFLLSPFYLPLLVLQQKQKKRKMKPHKREIDHEMKPLAPKVVQNRITKFLCKKCDFMFQAFGDLRPIHVR